MGLFDDLIKESFGGDDTNSTLVRAAVNQTLGPEILKAMDEDGSHFVVNPDSSVRFFINTPELEEKIDKAFAIALEKDKQSNGNG